MTGASATNTAAVTLASVQQARERIRGFIYESPCRASAELSVMTGQETFLKLDNLQRTGAFKERGALNKILTLGDEEKRRGVITASAGNHAQAVAYHACARGHAGADRDAADDSAGEGGGDQGLWRRGGAAWRQLRRGVCVRAGELRGAGHDVSASVRRR